MGVIVSRRRLFDREVRLICDGVCSKAWGINLRPRVSIDPDNEDDYAYLADGELDVAPADPGSYEGGYAKPVDGQHNKWCVRECERSSIAPADGTIPMPRPFRLRFFNKMPHTRPGDV